MLTSHINRSLPPRPSYIHIVCSCLEAAPNASSTPLSTVAWAPDNTIRGTQWIASSITVCFELLAPLPSNHLSVPIKISTCSSKLQRGQRPATTRARRLARRLRSASVNDQSSSLGAAKLSALTRMIRYRRVPPPITCPTRAEFENPRSNRRATGAEHRETSSS